MNDSVKIRPRVILATYYKKLSEINLSDSANVGKEDFYEGIIAVCNATKELGKKYDISIILKGKAINKKDIKWHNGNIILFKKFNETNKKNFVINKLFEFFNFINIFFLLKKCKFDSIIFRDLPGHLIIFSNFKKRFNYKLFYQSTAPLGDINIIYGKSKKTVNRYGYIIKGIFFNICEKMAFNKADIIFPISEYQKRNLEKNYPKKTIIPISMGVDEDWINYKSSKKSFLEKIKEKNKIITYFGTLNSTRNPQFIILIFNEMKKQIKKTKLLLIGSANKKYETEYLKNMVNELGLQNDVIFTGSLDRYTLIHYLKYCDVSISAIPPCKIYKFSSPTKLYESLGNCIPVVANKGIMEHEKVIKQSGGGFLVDYNTKEFSNAIIKLLKNDELRINMGKSGKAYVLKEYNYRLIAKRIEKYFI